MPFHIALLFGSYRRERVGSRVAAFVARRFRERGHEVTMIDAREVGLPMLDRIYPDYPEGEAPAELERLATIYRRADAFVVVSGEYNHGIQPGLKNLLDHFYAEYRWRPSAIVSYSAGTFAGARAAIQLREVLGELGMPAIPRVYPVARAGDVLAEDGGEKDAAAGRRFDRFAAELEWYAEAMKAQRAKGTPF
jgi:NAD(P)H-dependent FMN reductase